MDIVAIQAPAINRPGIGGFLLLAEIENFATFGAAAVNTLPGDEMRIIGNHTFVADKGFVQWDTEDDVSKVMLPIVGARSSLGFKPAADLFFPGLDPVKAWSFIQNKKFIGLFSAFGCNSSKMLQLGDKCNPLRLMPSDGFDSGVAGGNDARGFKVKMGSNYSVYFYEGTITMYPDAE